MPLLTSSFFTFGINSMSDAAMSSVMTTSTFGFFCSLPLASALAAPTTEASANIAKMAVSLVSVRSKLGACMRGDSS